MILENLKNRKRWLININHFSTDLTRGFYVNLLWPKNCKSTSLQEKLTNVWSVKSSDICSKLFCHFLAKVNLLNELAHVVKNILVPHSFLILLKINII
ncbi:hypothetical protein BpHYR1_045891 [Brachionus plicatilis]|uniref:Uncharacterized protein n=1 Tax=Brachionus plicatilis TaxID=10195 RepID=A0A3M7S7L4_BRAPC|nr:hypothetical protein BpHYR1_045891 [Brachionus plicatilis]